MSSTPYIDRFDAILKGMSALHSKKGADYGGHNDPYANVRASQEFGIDPWIGALVRLNDKITRLKSFIRNGNLQNESVEDSIRDIQVYAVIMQILYEEQDPKDDGRIQTYSLTQAGEDLLDTLGDPQASPAEGHQVFSMDEMRAGELKAVYNHQHLPALPMTMQVSLGHVLDWLDKEGHTNTAYRLRRDAGMEV